MPGHTQQLMNVMGSGSLAVRHHPSVHIIVLNWNGWQDTVECIAALQQLDYPDYHIVVADNSSTDGSEQHIRSAYPDIDLLQTGANLGYAGGNNVAIRHALQHGAEYILIVNPDLVLESQALHVLIQTAIAHPDIGALSPVVFYKDRPHDLWSSGTHIDWQQGRITCDTTSPPPASFYPSEGAAGCCMLLSARALQTVGLFDERYFLIHEETDLCQRMLAAGFRVGFCTDVSVLHQGHSALKNESPKQTYYSTRNRLVFFRRHRTRHDVSPWLLLWRLSRQDLLCLPIAKALIRRDNRAFARVYAYVDFVLARLGRSPRYE